jgi:hypothetical protein
MRASVRIGPYAAVCACAHALPCKIARARACICISRIVHHNLSTCVLTQLSMPQEHARTGTHSRACTQEAVSGTDAAEAPSESESDTELSDGRGDDIVSDSESEVDAQIGREPRSNNKRRFQVVVDDEIALEEGQIRAQMVRWSCFSAALRRSLRMILSDCSWTPRTSSDAAGSDPFVPDFPTAPHLLAGPLAIFA